MASYQFSLSPLIGFPHVIDENSRVYDIVLTHFFVFMYVCVQGVTCTTTYLNTVCSARRKCVSMLLKSSWVWSICTTASLSTETSR